MKTKSTLGTLLTLALLTASHVASAQSTAFTYQGRLSDGAGPANGSYDFRFALYGSQSGGSAVSGFTTNGAVPVTNGVFTVQLDFGPGVFTGPERWLEIGVRTNGASTFATLSPRQPILPTPYAMHAANADLLDGMNFTAFAQAAHSHAAADIVSGLLAPARGGIGIDTSATLAGSLLRTTGTGTWSPLAPGADTHVLKISSGQLTWAPDNDSGGTVTSVNTGTGLTGGPITTSGTIAIDPAVVPRLGANNIFTGSNIFNGVILATNASNSFAGVFSGSGSALSNLNASALNGPLPGGAVAGTYSNAVAFNNSGNTFHGSFLGNGLGLSNVNALTLNGLTSSDVWQLGGNNVLPGHFLGSTNNEAVELRVNGTRALRLEPNTSEAPNLIGGSPRNRVENGAVGATIGGGGAVNSSGFSYTNRVGESFGTIGGGADNTIEDESYSATIAGGYLNTIQYGSAQSAIAGGSRNRIGSNSFGAFIAGGYGHLTEGFATSIGGGYQNVIGTNTFSSAVGGGFLNVIESDAALAVIAGGQENRIESNAGLSAIGGGSRNLIEQGASQSVIAGGQDNRIESNAGLSAIGGGWLNLIEQGADQSVIAGGNAGKIRAGARESFIAGGFANSIGTNAAVSFVGGGTGNAVGSNSIWSVIAGGQNNSIQLGASHATIGGGTANIVSGGGGFVGGGIVNRAENFDAVVVGGGGNVNAGYRAFIGSGEGNLIGTNASHAAIGGGIANHTESPFSMIAGGRDNLIGTNGFDATIAGGRANLIASIVSGATIGGGQFNVISTNGNFSTLAGGSGNIISNQADRGVIGGGSFNTLRTLANHGTIAGGTRNTVLANAQSSSIGGGRSNSVGAVGATIPGGILNSASGNSSFAAGHRANALHAGSFVWADSADAPFSSTALNQFLIRAGGGVGIGVNNPSSALEVSGVVRAGAFEGNGSGLTSLSGANLSPGSVGAGALANNIITTANIVDGSVIAADLQPSTFATTFWKVDGNTGTSPGTHFLGTTDNQALELKVNNIRGLRLEPNGSDAPHVIGGSISSTVDPGHVGVFIGGGGQHIGQGDWTSIGGGERNYVAGRWSTVGGGQRNDAAADHSTVGGGNNNRSVALAATIGGGDNNRNVGMAGTVGGGQSNNSNFDKATVGGGATNSSDGFAATIAGGQNNLSGGAYATIGGGEQNASVGQSATVPGGQANLAAGDYSFAAGRRAKANHHGTFIWADSRDDDFSSLADNQFLVRANFVGINRANRLSGNEYFGIRAPVTNTYGGMYIETVGTGLPFYGYYSAGSAGVAWSYLDGTDGNKWKLYVGGPRLTVTPGSGNVGIGTEAPSERLHVIGNILASGTVTGSSDRHRKENIRAVNPREVLDKVAALPIARWNYKEEKGVKHVGPMAQDFYAAFELGRDDKHISMVDADGVALAAIQGLNQKVEEQAAELRGKDAELRTLKERLADLEKVTAKLAAMMKSADERSALGNQ